jgi:cytochrome c oxidase subunit 3
LSARQQAERRKAERSSPTGSAHAAAGERASAPIDVSRIARLSAFVPAHGTFFAIYYTLTGLHALHVIGGLIVLAYLIGPGASMRRTQPVRFTHRAAGLSIYWQFVDIVWILVFLTVYLL